MKKTAICFILLLLMAATPLLAVEKELQGRIGAGYATDPSRFGLDLAFQHTWKLDPYFVMGPEVGFFWIQWDRKIGTEGVGAARVDVKADTNSYVLPVFMNAQLRLPVMKKYIYVEPFLTVGLGWGVMILHYSQPSFEDTSQTPNKQYDDESITKFFHGFSWQLIFGAAFQPDGSKVGFLGELGYRGMKLEYDNTEVDMSGFMIRLGVRYPFGTSGK